MLKNTAFCGSIYAVGSSKEPKKHSGIYVDKTRYLGYATLFSMMMSAQISVGLQSMEKFVRWMKTAAIIGGASLKGWLWQQWGC